MPDRRDWSMTAVLAFAACLSADGAFAEGAGPPEEAPTSAASPAKARAASESPLLARYRNASVDALLQAAQRASTATAAAERRSDAACAAMRELVERGLARRAAAADRATAIETLGLLSGETELRAAGKVLAGEGSRADFIASDPAVRRAYFSALARDDAFGQPRLVELAVLEEDPVRQRALDAMPESLSNAAQQTLARLLDSDRELHVNRAAMIAGAFGRAILIPSLVSAQYEPPRATRGDEAWIAIGKTVTYVQGVVPVVGDASGAFQPVLGTVYEGSVLRIMESVVEIYRTEASSALAMVVERETGRPAPPLGYDQGRWLAWYDAEFPALAAAHAEARAQSAHADRVRVEGTRDDL